MNKAVFLDRDGVINYECGSYTTNVSDFKINNGIVESVKMLRDNDFLVIIITNQGGIAKGLYTADDLLEMHIKLCETLAEEDTAVTDMFFCPHHQEYGKCLCRKPEPLLIEKALAVYNIDPAKSYMIGDSKRDIEAARRAGVKSIKISPNENIVKHVKNIIDNG